MFYFLSKIVSTSLLEQMWPVGKGLPAITPLFRTVLVKVSTSQHKKTNFETFRKERMFLRNSTLK